MARMREAGASLRTKNKLSAEQERVLDGYRRWGYLAAELDPLGFLQPELHPELETEGPAAAEARRVYCGTIGAEFMYIADPARRRWLAESYVIAQGTGRMEVGDLPPADVAPGDTVFIPAGVRQRITNTGAADLVFYCICTPRFTSACYRAL